MLRGLWRKKGSDKGVAAAPPAGAASPAPPAAAAAPRTIVRHSSGTLFVQEPVTELEADSFALLGAVGGYASIQGYRASNEDAHVMAVLPGMEGWGVVAVLDGHAGRLTADTAAAALPAALAAAVGPVRHSMRGVETAIRRAFMELDAQLLGTHAILAEGSGSTCVAAVWGPCSVHIVNLGDSRAALYRDGRPRFATRDHVPTDPNEAARIAAAGGRVLNGRVDGGLSVCRAFGGARPAPSPPAHHGGCSPLRQTTSTRCADRCRRSAKRSSPCRWWSLSSAP